MEVKQVLLHGLVWLVCSLLVGCCCRPISLAMVGAAAAGVKGGDVQQLYHHHRPARDITNSKKKSFYPAIFVFGDSLSDTGNNKNLVTLAKVTRLPYGRDSPSHAPIGRFSNGLIGPDFVADFIGLPSPPPYRSARENILQGVSFASSGSGILNSSGNVFGQHLPLAQQVTDFTKVRAALQARLGEEGVSRFLSKALFYINIGSNDYVVNYFLTNGRVPSPLQAQYSPSQFEDLLLSNLELRILELYAMGARKVAVVGLALLGCVPFQVYLQRSKTGQCIDSINKLTQNYNAALLQRLQALQGSHPDARFTYLDTYNLLASIVKQPSAYGFNNITTACCGSGPFNALPTCSVPGLYRVCQDASKYVFWDFVHPTSAIDKIAATRFWLGKYPEVNPLNLKELALGS